MKKTVTIALATMLAAAPLAGVAYAEDAATKGAMTATEGDAMATGAITADNVEVMQLSGIEADKDQTNLAETLKMKANDPANMQKVQAELQSDAALVEILASKNVQIQNVIDVQTAANGGKIVYVK